MPRRRSVIDPDTEEGYPLLDQYVMYAAARGESFSLPPPSRAALAARAMGVARKILTVRYESEYRALYDQALSELTRAFPDVPSSYKRKPVKRREKFVPYQKGS